MTFDTIREARDFVKRYEEVANFKIYGNTRYEYAFIADTFRGIIDWDISHLSVVFIDIEVGSENGFPDPYKATEPITAIAIHQLNGGTTVYGYGNYEVKGEETYVRCEDEIDFRVPVEGHIQEGQASRRGGADGLHPWQSVHRCFQRKSDHLLHFFGCHPSRLGHDRDCGLVEVGEDIHRGLREGKCPVAHQHCTGNEYQ